MIGEKELEMMLTAEPRTVQFVRAVVDDFCHASLLDDRHIEDIKIAVSEACTNVVMHAYEGRSGAMKLKLKVSDNRVSVTVADFGRGLASSPEKSTIRKRGDIEYGGFGIFIIKDLVDDFDLRSNRKGTELYLVKRLN